MGPWTSKGCKISTECVQGSELKGTGDKAQLQRRLRNKVYRRRGHKSHKRALQISEEQRKKTLEAYVLEETKSVEYK